METRNWLADKGYDNDDIRQSLREQGILAHRPPRKNRKAERPYDKHLYKEGHNVECLFSFLKHYRRLFANLDKL